MDIQLFALLKALTAGVLVPVLLGGALSRWAARPPGRAGALALGVACGLLSGLAALTTGGLVTDARALPLVQLVGAARILRPEELPGSVGPHLANLSRELAHQDGREATPAEIEGEVARMLAVLETVRGLDESEMGRRLPDILRALVRGRERPLLFERLTWSPQLDGALVVPLAAGLAGGPLAGLTAGALGALVRARLLGTPPPLLILTLIAGLLGALAGARVREDRLGARGAFALGLALGLAQLAWAALLAPPGVVGPDTLIGGAALALVHASGFALVASMLRLARLETVQERLAQAEVRARLDLLTAQVQPHFLFNALNTIASTADDAAVTRRLIGCLARFLRLSLKPNAGHVALSDELAHLEAYLDLERARWPDRLTVTVTCAADAAAVPVPPLIVQPLVENAVAHGFRADGEPLAVRVEARLTAGRLVVQVIDDGAGVSPVKLVALARGDNLGIGLASVRERLRALEPPGQLELASTSAGFEARLSVPAREVA